MLGWALTYWFYGNCQPYSSQVNDSLPLIPAKFLQLKDHFPETCIIKGSETSKMIALTFDDGPSNVTNKVLNILEANNVQATFFWLGKNLSQNQSIVRKAIAAGHQIGNHSWDHSNPINISPHELWSKQLSPTNATFDSLFGISPTLFRPPFGTTTPEQIQFINARGMKTVLWSITTLDWDLTQNTSEEILRRFKKHLHSGGIVLLHDVDFNNTHTEMLNALHDIIQYAKANDYNLVTIQELIKNK